MGGRVIFLCSCLLLKNIFVILSLGIFRCDGKNHPEKVLISPMTTLENCQDAPLPKTNIAYEWMIGRRWFHFETVQPDFCIANFCLQGLQSDLIGFRI